MGSETILFVGLQSGLTVILIGVIAFLLWRSHSARHREIKLDMDRRYMDTVNAMRDFAPNGHTHVLEQHSHAEFAAVVHDHPHDHEHVVHTHNLEAVSEHEDNGKKVVVKRCRNCATIFRDEAS